MRQVHLQRAVPEPARLIYFNEEKEKRRRWLKQPVEPRRLPGGSLDSRELSRAAPKMTCPACPARRRAAYRLFTQTHERSFPTGDYL